MRTLQKYIHTAASLAWFAIVAFPALALYVASLGSVSLDFFFGRHSNMIEMTIPGWSRNTFSYGLPTWRPF